MSDLFGCKIRSEEACRKKLFVFVQELETLKSSVVIGVAKLLTSKTAKSDSMTTQNYHIQLQNNTIPSPAT